MGATADTIKRVEWIDSLKGFGVICVLVGHLAILPIAERYIYSFHMPLFFFVSGLFYKTSGDSINFFKKKIKSLMIPFLIWDALSAVVAFITGIAPKEIFEGALFLNGKRIWNAPIWFLLVLFFAECLYMLLKKHNCPSWCIIAGSIVMFLLIGEYKRMPFLLNILPMAILFYAIGHKSTILLQQKFEIIKYKTIIFILGLFSVMFGAILNCRVSYTQAIWGNMIFFLIAAVTGVFFFTLLFWKLPNSNFFSYFFIVLGKNSLFFLCTQYWYRRFFNHIFDCEIELHLFSRTNTGIGYTIFMSALIIMCSLICIEVVHYFSERNRVIAKISYMVGIR